MPAMNVIRACRFGRHQYCAEQLWDDGRWYQRGSFFESAEQAEDYGLSFCTDSPTVAPMICRDKDGKVLMPAVTKYDTIVEAGAVREHAPQ